jgi:hypothetical protein
MKSWIRNHQLVAFFSIAFVIMFGVLFGFVYLRPGQVMESWSLVWFFSVFSPTFSALLVSWVIGGWPEVKQVLSGFKRWKVGFFWYFAAAFLFLAPLVICLVYITLGNPSPGVRAGETTLSMAGIVLFTLFSGPIAEELGWRGFALPRLQARFNALISSLILGFIWTCWHIPLFFVPGASQVSIPFPIYLVLVMTITIYLSWLYNNTGGSLVITVLGHFFFNLTGFLTGVLRLMPAMTFYFTSGPLLFLVVLAVIFYYKPKYLSRKPEAEYPVYRELS